MIKFLSLPVIMNLTQITMCKMLTILTKTVSWGQDMSFLCFCGRCGGEKGYQTFWHCNRLDKSWSPQNRFRCEEPNFLTAFNEDNVDLFPVNDETENFLEVPSCDHIVENCLINRYGNKAAFDKSGVVKSKSLFTQPSKMIEKVAYRGQQAAISNNAIVYTAKFG